MHLHIFCCFSKAAASLLGVDPLASEQMSLEEQGRVAAIGQECCPTWQFTPKNLNSVTSDQFWWDFPPILFCLVQ